MHILITRPYEEACITASHLQHYAIKTSIDPLLTITPCKDIDTHIRHIMPQTIGGIIISSANILPLLTPYRFLHDITMFTVGKSTHHKATALGFSSVMLGETMEALINHLPQHLTPSDALLWYPSARHTRMDIVPILQNNGYHIQRSILYEAVAATGFSAETMNHLAAHDFTAIVFYSARSAAIFVELLTQAQLSHSTASLYACTLSTQVAQPLKALHWKAIHIASSPTHDAMIELASNLCKT